LIVIISELQRAESWPARAPLAATFDHAETDEKADQFPSERRGLSMREATGCKRGLFSRYRR
jgi:hypothetical protein